MNYSNENGNRFTDIFVDFDYPLETLINGNKSECINHLREFLKIGCPASISYIHDSLLMIFKNFDFGTYEYVKTNVFKP